MQTDSGVVYQFGPFEVTPASLELLKNGRRIKLQELPYRLLVALLENPGKVLSRDELRGRLWPEDTFVDFDSSLRVAVGKLREALDDDAEAPRYIETIPKRGYRFLVTEVRRAEAPEASQEIAQSREDPQRLNVDEVLNPENRSRNSWLKYGIAAVATLDNIMRG